MICNNNKYFLIVTVVNASATKSHTVFLYDLKSCHRAVIREKNFTRRRDCTSID